MRFRTIQAGPLMQMPVFLILFFAPVYVPLDLLTGWIARRSRRSIRSRTCSRPGAASSPGEPEQVALAFALAAALAGVLALWAFRGLRRAEAAG